MTAEQLYNILSRMRTSERRKASVVCYNTETDNFHEATDAYHSDIDGFFIIRHN